MSDSLPPKSRRAFLRESALLAGGCVFSWAVAAESSTRIALFNGRDLTEWKAMPRLPVPQFPGAPEPKVSAESLARNKAHTGRWVVEDGAIVGGQESAGSKLGAYLVHDRTFGDFELEYEARPDWRVDTGVMIRALPAGSPGIQVLCDHRPAGGLAGYFFNGTGSFLATPFLLDGETDADGKLTRLFAATKPEKLPIVPPTFAVTLEEFTRAWRLNEWNQFRVRCVGAVPVLTTWINGVKVVELDTNKVQFANWHPERVRDLLGPRGHIAFEVHSNPPADPHGDDRWAPGAVCRWRNVFVTEL
ncbi:MAG: DUF1080 domain-containing protein [Verrucomicrobiota bacterium]|nr:DUF1080 domain-containing protein [Verrucomicrobiota bacterium]